VVLQWSKLVSQRFAQDHAIQRGQAGEALGDVVELNERHCRQGVPGFALHAKQNGFRRNRKLRWLPWWRKFGFERAAKVSLTPGFSRVWAHAARENRLNGFRWSAIRPASITPEKPLKTVSSRDLAAPPG
jgi:hypothetical protein